MIGMILLILIRRLLVRMMEIVVMRRVPMRRQINQRPLMLVAQRYFGNSS
jgi:hypothetical protein